MREDIGPLVSIALFLWSIWTFNSGDHSLAYFLLGSSIYVTVALAAVYAFSIDTLTDRIEKAISHQTDVAKSHNAALLSRIASMQDVVKR